MLETPTILMNKKRSLHFELSERKILLRFLDVFTVLFGLYVVGSLFNFDYFVFRDDKWLWSLLLSGYILLFGEVFEIYDIQKSSDFFKIFPGIVITASVTILVYVLTPFITPELPESRLQILYFYLSIVVSIMLGRLSYINLINAPIFVKNAVLISNGDDLDKIEEELRLADPNYRIVYFINTSNNKIGTIKNGREIEVSNLMSVMNRGINEIVVTRNTKFLSPKLYRDLLKLFNLGYVIKDYSQVYEELTNKVYVSFNDSQLYQQFPFSKYNNRSFYKLIHRLFDLFFGTIGMLCMILILPFVIIINVFANRGPLFYTQERVGQHGKVFKIFKLRSMVVNAEKNGAVWAQKNDTRITRFGKFLRKTRLDELPQFINIIKGDMSIIGPRPERSVFVEELVAEIPFFSARNIIKPGLTGWAQVNAGYGASVEDSLHKLQYDLYYIKHRNVFLDFKIVLKTLSTVIFFRGT